MISSNPATWLYGVWALGFLTCGIVVAHTIFDLMKRKP